jgi:hypothetical protein
MVTASKIALMDFQKFLPEEMMPIIVMENRPK